MAIGTAGYTAMLCVLALERHRRAARRRRGAGHGGHRRRRLGGVALLAKLGYKVVAATGKAAEADYLKSLGASAVIDRGELAAPGKPLQRSAGPP